MNWPEEERWVLIEGDACKDQGVKLRLQEKHGVKEYWIINPATETISVYRRKGSGTSFEKPLTFNKVETAPAGIFPGRAVPLAEVLDLD